MSSSPPNVIGSILATLGGIASLAFFLVVGGLGLTLIFAPRAFMSFSDAVMPIIQNIGGITFVASIFIGIPLLIFRQSRPISGLVFAITALVFGVIITLSSISVIYFAWGHIPLVIAVFLFPALTPLAAIALVIDGDWATLGNLAVAVGIWLAAAFGASVATNTRRY